MRPETHRRRRVPRLPGAPYAAADPRPAGERPEAPPLDPELELHHAETRRRWTRLVFYALLLGLSIWVLKGFLAVFAWAVILAIATWPLYRRIVRALRAEDSSVTAPLLATLGIGLALLLPLTYAAIGIGREVRVLVRWAAVATHSGVPIPPWLSHLPWVGGTAVAWWQANLADPHAASELMGHVNTGLLVDFTRTYGVQLLHRAAVFALTILTLFFLYRHGTVLAGRARLAAHRLMGEPGERYILQMASAVGATVNGMVLVGLGEGLLLGLAYVMLGVPNPVLLGAATGLFAMVPFAAPLIFGAASLYLLTQGLDAEAIGLFLFGTAVLFVADHFIRPALIGSGARLPFLWALLGVLGGLETLGLFGLFLGPVIMAVLIAAWRELVHEPA
ncbi:MAG: AI-2E family transporter [Dongiaceae bacterium]